MTGREKNIDGEEKNIPTVGIFYSQAGNVLFPRWEKMTALLSRKEFFRKTFGCFTINLYLCPEIAI